MSGPRALQQAHLNWRKKVNESRLREAILSSRGAADSEFGTRDRAAFAVARWRDAIIRDELTKPLVVSHAALAAYERRDGLDARCNAAEAARHAASFRWLSARLRARDDDAARATDSPSAASGETTYGLMRDSLDKLEGSIRSHAGSRASRQTGVLR